MVPPKSCQALFKDNKLRSESPLGLTKASCVVLKSHAFGAFFGFFGNWRL